MSSKRGASLAVPVLVIAVGIGWLLTALGYAPAINWVWTIGLAVAGILTIALSGLDKVSVVIGPFFLLASVLSVFRQTGGLAVNVEVPVLVISVGVFLLIAQLPIVPPPGWMRPLPTPSVEDRADPPKKLRL
jgi:hypothetical protein